jgi:hypothetical protein
MQASNLLLNAYTRNANVLGGRSAPPDRAYQPHEAVCSALDRWRNGKVLRVIVEIALKPSIELGQLVKEALSKSLDPDPLLAFSSTCRADLDNVRRTTT